MRIRLIRQDLAPSALSALASRWRDLETRADPSPFQSWTWVGCQLAQRFTHPYLLEAVDPAGVTQALALFNRRHRRLHLHETGDPALDAPFIEHNAPLVATTHADLRPALFHALPAALTLSGTDPITAQAARSGRAVLSLTTRQAPILDLSLPVLDTPSANTRAQLRRALRRYATWGPLTVTRADTPAVARAVLSALIPLHASRWLARNQPGAFADPRTLAFHHALIERGVPRNEVDLLTITAGDRTVGFLYNLHLNGRVFAYQAGFSYAAAAAEPSSAQLKPGLVCHALAAEWYRTRGAGSYDLGAGDTRYKRSLATGSSEMQWLSLASPTSLAAYLATVKRFMRPRSASASA